MTRVKKSRKVGRIGITKKEAPKKIKKIQLSKSTNTSGNKAGSRQHINDSGPAQGLSKAKQDPRVGSKKAIDLHKYQVGKIATTTVEPKPRYKTPQQELDAIEQDQKLEALLEKQESKKLSIVEQEYVTVILKRHKQLCDILGIDMVEDESEQDSDPFAEIDAIKLTDFKD